MDSANYAFLMCFSSENCLLCVVGLTTHRTSNLEEIPVFFNSFRQICQSEMTR